MNALLHPHHVLLAALALAAVAAPAGAGIPGVDDRIDERMIVHVAPTSSVGAFIAAFEGNHPTVSLTAIDQVPGRRIHLLEVTLPPGHTQAFVDLLEQDLETGYLDLLVSTPLRGAGEFLYTNEGPEGKTGSTWLCGLLPEEYLGQYSLPIIGAPAAQARSTGLGTVIALLDTGIDATHPELAGRVLPGGYNFVDDNTDIRDIGDGEDNDSDGMTDEMTGHGTFVGGLLILVAPDAKILPVRVLNSDGVGDEWKLTRGIYYAIDRGVEVINLSLGSTYDTVAVKQALLDAALNGITVVAAAGNFDRPDPREHPAMDDIDPDDPVLPAIEIPGALGVAATDPDDIKATFSNYNRRLAISAPGAAGADLYVVSTMPGEEYVGWEGTSFSTAFVSGAAALIRAQHPEWAADLGTNLIIADLLEATAVDIYPLNPLHAPGRELGAGRLDIAAAVSLGPVAPSIPGDLDNDGRVNVFDLLRVLQDWGLTHTPADLDGNGTVNVLDVLVLLANWG